MSNEPNDATKGYDSFVLLILSSPSGAGKSTLASKLKERFADMRFSVSHTTRAPRIAERNGTDYHFVDRDEFELMVDAGKFVEWAHVHGNLYGTSAKEIENARETCGGVIFDVDFQGARQIKSRHPEAVAVFILPPSLDELERRLRNRASDSEESIECRLKAAIGEIEHYGFFDYVVVNDCLQEASEKLFGIVMAERCRRNRCARMAETMLREAHRR